MEQSKVVYFNPKLLEILKHNTQMSPETWATLFRIDPSWRRLLDE